MHITKRRLVTGSVLVSMISLAACGGSDEPKTAATSATSVVQKASEAVSSSVAATASASAAATPPAESAAPTASTPAVGGKLKMWVMGSDGKSFSELVKKFTADTGVKVDVEGIPWDNVNDKLTTSVASGKGPDVLQIGLSNLAAFRAADALKDLTPDLAKYPTLASESFIDGMAADKLNGSGPVVTVPWVSDTRVLFYRDDLLEAAGIQEPPATWTEFHDYAVKLAAAGGKGKHGYYIPQWDQSLPSIFTWQSGGEVEDASGKVTFDTPEFKRAADFYLSFYKDKAVPMNADFDQTQGFVSGSAPMLVSGPYLAKAIDDAAPELKGKWKVAPLPKGDTGTSVVAGSTLGVWKTSKNADAAMALLDYLSQPATQVEWFKLSNELPTVKAALADPVMTSDPTVAVYSKQLEDAKLLPLAPKWGQIATEQLNALNGIALKGADKDKTLAALNEAVAELQK